MEVFSLKSENINQVARMHCHELSGYLSELGEGFLKKFYKVSLDIPEMFTIVAHEKGQVLGFVSAIDTAKGFYRKIFFKAPFSFSFLLIKSFLARPQLIIKTMKTFYYPGFANDMAELFSIAVNGNCRGLGVGKKLFKETAAEFKRRGVLEFYIGVYDKLPANGFYKKIGCEIHRSFTFQGEKMNYYLYPNNEAPSR